MFSHLGPAEVARIDWYINRFCSNPSSYAELNQLHRLFTSQFGKALERLLNRSLQRDGRPVVSDIQIGWIDKIPIARSPSLSKGTELGDAILFAFDERRDFNGKLQTERARAVILQAKVARSAAQLSAPSVPVGTGLSSKNELTLLSGWPRFDLYETARNSSPCLTSVSVAPGVTPPPEAWFIAAPGYSLSTLTKPNWPCWWMAGESYLSSSCKTTIGQLLVGFLNPNSSTSTVGSPFNRQVTSVPASVATTPTDWSKLCNEIQRILALHYAPRSLFGIAQPRLRSIPLWAELFIRIDPSKRALVMDAAAGTRRLFRPCYDLFPHSPAPELKTGKKRIFILTVTVTRFGEE